MPKINNEKDGNTMDMNRILASGAITEQNGTRVFAAAPGVNINEGHSLIMDGYEPILHDMMLREFPIGLSLNEKKASGPVHMWNEQLKLPNNTVAMDPKLGIGTTTPDYASPIADTDYGRDNWKSAQPRLYGSRIQYDYFTMKMEQEYGEFEDLTIKDYNDMINMFTKTKANDFFNGRSTSLTDVASTYKFEHTGILSQITDNSAIDNAILIADALNTKIAGLQARLDYTGLPDVLCMNSATYDLLVKEEQKRENYVQNITSEIIPGWSVPAIRSYHMTMPIMLTPFVKPVDNGTTVTHKIVALNRSYIDKIYWINNGPQFFEFANPNQPQGNQRLLTNKQMLEFSTNILRFPHTGMHFTMTRTITK